MAFVLDQNLKAYATDCQWKKLQALEEHGSERKAAKALGVHHRAIAEAKSAVIKKAAQTGYAPEYDLVHPAAPGMIVKGTSIRYNEDGVAEQYWNKTRMEGRDPEESVRLPDPKTITKVSTLYDQQGRVTQQWVAEKPEAVAQMGAWEEFAKALAEDLPRVEPIPAPATLHSDLLVAYPVGDHHLGMLSWSKETGADYDMKISEQLLMGAMDHLVQAAPAADTGLVVFLGDFLHYDSFEPVTPTNRNQLDSDTRYPKMVRAGIRCMRYMVDAALRKHKIVHVMVEIGNHDLSSSIFLMECLSCIYEKEPRVTVDTSPQHYHYFQFGEVLIGTHHGHGTKMSSLPLIMAADCPKEWGETTYRYWWTGHVHHGKTQAAVVNQDYVGCSVESFRVLAPVDAWAHQKGYRSARDMNSIIIHKRFGEVSRNRVNPEMFS